MGVGAEGWGGMGVNWVGWKVRRKGKGVVGEGEGVWQSRSLQNRRYDRWNWWDGVLINKLIKS